MQRWVRRGERREKKMEYTPSDWAKPKWNEARKVHDWKNYISEEIAQMWHTFTEVQKQALARQADEMAGREEWD